MFAALINNTIVYSERQSRGNGITSMIVPFESLITDYGVLIPTSTVSWNILDLIEGRDPATMCSGWLIDQNGVVREVVTDRFNRIVRRLPAGAGVFYVRSDSLDVENLILAAHDISGGDVDKFIAAIYRALAIPKDTIKTISISQVRRKVARRKFKAIEIP